MSRPGKSQPPGPWATLPGSATMEAGMGENEAAGPRCTPSPSHLWRITAAPHLPDPGSASATPLTWTDADFLSPALRSPQRLPAARPSPCEAFSLVLQLLPFIS